MIKKIALRLIIIIIFLFTIMTLSACESDIIEPEPVITEPEPVITEPEPVATEHLPPSIFPIQFNATNLNGDAVNETTLGEKRLFIVHLWGTWCPPCVAEMPELSEVAKMFEDEVGFIGLLDDFNSNKDGALQIKEASGAPKSFINIDAHLPELAGLLNMLNAKVIPTTILIDGEGNIIGEHIIGARGLDYKIYIEDALNAN